jgi:parvulin-like peptidyl-prolyl isomerase
VTALQLRLLNGVSRIACIACASASLTAFAAPQPAPDTTVFARVGDATITRQDYELAVAAAVRSKFYHGKAPEAEVLKLRREVGERLVDNVVLRKEAQRRGIAPDAAAVKKQLDAQEARYRGNPQWQARRDEIVPALTRRLEEESVLAQLEASVRDVPAPGAKEVEAYYAANKDKFTEPEQVKVSLILLKVDPSSPKAKWEAARDEAAKIVAKARAKADFAQLARKHSADESAARGGELGYLHRGMLPEAAQDALDRVKPVAVTDPVVLLEGVALFRLEDRKSPKLQSFAEARERASALLRREQSEAAWRGLIAKLRKEMPAKVDEAAYANVVTATGPGRPVGR